MKPEREAGMAEPKFSIGQKVRVIDSDEPDAPEKEIQGRVVVIESVGAGRLYFAVFHGNQYAVNEEWLEAVE